jgi:HlyD family type I secretion membrane fusion protein
MSELPQRMANAADIALPDADYTRPVRIGLWILLAGFGGFLAWAFLAPLEEGVPAPGVVSVESKRKRIDHLNGGIVEKILVREGEQVRAGQDLLVLNDTQARAALNSVESQWRAAIASEARLKAERDGAREVTFPKELIAVRGEQDVAAAMRAQEELFRARRGALEGELGIIRESVRGLDEQIASLEQLQRGREKQVALFQEQLASYRKLNSGGFISRNQLIDTERQLAEVQTKQSEDLSNTAAVKARLAEFRMRASQRQVEYRREVEGQLTDVQKEVATLGERLTAQRDVHGRLVISAPVDGTVVDLAFHTVGGVVKAGERILDIVPDGDEFIIEAQVAPQYIDRVRAGLPADVHFDAFMNQLRRLSVAGTVTVASADVLTDARSGTPYYTVRVTVPGSELEKLGSFRLQPGMPATVMVKTGERSLMVYLTRPLLRRFNSALTER